MNSKLRKQKLSFIEWGQNPRPGVYSLGNEPLMFSRADRTSTIELAPHIYSIIIILSLRTSKSTKKFYADFSKKTELLMNLIK
jgi:hypothetical protein